METARFHESKGSSHLAQNFIHAAGAIAAGVATAASTVVHLASVCTSIRTESNRVLFWLVVAGKQWGKKNENLLFSFEKLKHE